MKGVLNQIAMTQSKQEYNPKQYAPLIRHQSPLRNHQNVNNMNIIQSPKTRKSLSPIRGRKKNIEMASPIKQHKKCQNHQNKEGNFYVESEKQKMYYCRSCAVRLASQGFEIMQQKDRSKEQIYLFIDQVKGIVKSLNSKKIVVDKVITKGDDCLDHQIEQISNYYSQFYQIIKEHESRVIEELKIQYQKMSKYTLQFANKLEDAVSTGQKMKKDLNICLNDSNFSTSLQGYDSIIAKYKMKLSEYNHLLSEKQFQKQFKVKTLSFKDCEQVCQILIENMQVQWNNEQKIHKNEMIQTEKSFESLLSGKKNKNANIFGSF